MSQMRMSSQFVLSGDCTAPQWYPSPFGTQPDNFDDCDKDDATKPALLFASDPGGLNVHRTGNNVLFADGHVELFARFEPSKMTFSSQIPQSWPDVVAQ